MDKNGAAVGMHGVTIDITERKVAEENLRRSESRLAEAQRMSRIGSWEWDLADNTLTWSDEQIKEKGEKIVSAVRKVLAREKAPVAWTVSGWPRNSQAKVAG